MCPFSAHEYYKTKNLFYLCMFEFLMSWFLSNRLIFFGEAGYLPRQSIGNFEFDETSFWVNEVSCITYVTYLVCWNNILKFAINFVHCPINKPKVVLQTLFVKTNSILIFCRIQVMSKRMEWSCTYFRHWNIYLEPAYNYCELLKNNELIIKARAVANYASTRRAVGKWYKIDSSLFSRSLKLKS